MSDLLRIEDINQLIAELQQVTQIHEGKKLRVQVDIIERKEGGKYIRIIIPNTSIMEIELLNK